MATRTSKTTPSKGRPGTSPTATGTTGRKATAKPVAAPEDGAARPEGLEMKKQELIEKVVQLSGVKKKDAKPVVEAMLEVLGETLAQGRGLNLAPLGKLKLNRTKETPNARIIVAKLRQNKSGKKPDGTGNRAVAEAAE
ncbi:DNA-binding protein [Roseovarius faecimaris]|uniref:DNA-binding protein n=1 Tax=Roseovarius faecimaris TaxID=2494550 RepID=A0A6I6J1M4_9RHOB|nr:HU family DNA-binding protein [Roseovarius faecimaris]QGX98658.1 DNA-binding protein [Roseovarius faecimaris]